MQPLTSTTPLFCFCAFFLFPFSYSFLFRAIESFFHLVNMYGIKMQSGCRGVLVPLYSGVYLKVWPLNLPHRRWPWKTILMSSTSARWSLSTSSLWRTAKWVQALCAHMLALKTAHCEVLIELRLNKRVGWWDVARIEHTLDPDWPVLYDNL